MKAAAERVAAVEAGEGESARAKGAVDAVAARW